MIKHIVFFRFTEKLSVDQKIERAEILRDIFLPLRTLPSVSEYMVGVNFNSSEDAWDLAIDSTFVSREALREYQISEEHRSAVYRAKQFQKEKSVIDYEFQ